MVVDLFERLRISQFHFGHLLTFDFHVRDHYTTESRAFAYAQQIGKSLFLPIAILPFAGILLGIGIDSVYINGVCVLDGDNINAEALKTTGHAVKC
ncbi:MAG: hypothetical protein IIY38_08025 [Clostridia bacterium]|nr:hypothetical protein [Clostridia bacterium]